MEKSISVVGNSGYRLFTLASVDKVEEIFCSNDESTEISERLFSSSLVAVVTTAEPHKLKVCHFKKGTEICNFSYPSNILSVRLNRSRLVICLNGSIYIHNIRDMKMLHSIRHIAPSDAGLCTLSLNSHLAYPISTTVGELQIYDAGDLSVKNKIKAHESPLSALNFSPNGLLLATASEKGTVIRVFCVVNGQKVHEFRRGVKRYVNIASLTFSNCATFICASSNTETVHIFKIDLKAVESAERLNCNGDDGVLTENNDSNGELDVQESRWTMGFITKAMTSYFPSPVSDVLNQDRAFATVQLAQAGLKHECVIVKLEKETKVLAACTDGFLYIYNFDDVKGGECKLLRAHDLRNPLFGVTEVNMDCDKNDSTIVMKNSVQPAPGSYASVLKGRDKDRMSAESDRCRDLLEAVCEYPKSMFDEVHFPPVAVSTN
ncbi:hypothetical protein HA402_004386 [Bradysia odoriphaga]|nr:hypothetical protein HA402_004386 [Bradysia odoriphaga]